MESMEPTLRIAAPLMRPASEALMKASAAGLFPAYYGEQAVASGIRYVAEPDPKSPGTMARTSCSKTRARWSPAAGGAGAPGRTP